MQKYLWPLVRPFLVKWLTTRAAVLPASKVQEIARKLNVDPAVVLAIDAEVLAQIPALLDQVRF
jgi:hypothetical protein